MVAITAILRQDKVTYPAFLMTHLRQEPFAGGGRVAEWVLASWMNYLDPNILGIRLVEEENSGRRRALSMMHIAIPLQYKRSALAYALGIEAVEDSRHTTRVNVMSSLGFDQPHSYIRVPVSVVIPRVLDLIRQQCLEAKTIEDFTTRLLRTAVEESRHTSPERLREQAIRLRSAVQQSLALRNARLEPYQIQIMIHKGTGEKWVRIASVDRSKRTSLKLAIKQVGIKIIPSFKNKNGDWGWALHFTAREARKLFPE
jgi:hypothetical protein